MPLKLLFDDGQVELGIPPAPRGTLKELWTAASAEGSPAALGALSPGARHVAGSLDGHLHGALFRTSTARGEADLRLRHRDHVCLLPLIVSGMTS